MGDDITQTEELMATLMTFLHSDGLAKVKLPPLHSMPTTFGIPVAEETPRSLLSAPSLVPSVQERIGETRDVSWPHSDLHCDRTSPWGLHRGLLVFLDSLLIRGHSLLDVLEPRPLTCPRID